MIRLFLWLLLGISAAWLVADVLRDNGPGYVLIYYNDYSLETSIWFGGLLLVGLVASIYLGIKLSILLFRYLLKIGLLPKALGAKQARSLQYQGTLSFLDQNWRSSAAQLDKAAKNSETPFLNYLMAARASLADGDLAQTERYLTQAQDQDQIDELSLAMMQLDLAMAKNDDARLHQLLEKLLQAYPGDKRFLRKALSVYQADQNWQAIHKLLPRLKKRKVINAEQLQTIERTALRGLLQQAAAKGDLPALRKLWKSAGKHQQQVELLYPYCQALIALDAESDAEKLLVSALKKQWHEGLISLYSQIRSDDIARQISLIEEQLDSDKHNPVVLVALARVCLYDELWGRAKGLLQKSLEIRPNIEAYQLLAQICEAHGEVEQAHRYLQSGLSLALR